MNRQEYIKTRYVFVATPILAIFSVTSIEALGGQNSLLMAGLSLDILGAIVLATPDLAIVKNHFQYGDLEAAREILLNMEEITPQENDKAYEILLDIFAEECSPSSEQLAATEKMSAGPGYGGGAALRIEKNDTDMIDAMEYSKAMRKVNEKMLPLEGRLRRAGITILISGFTLQLLSAILP